MIRSDHRAAFRRIALPFTAVCLFSLGAPVEESWAQTVLRGEIDRIYEKDIVPDPETAARIAEAVAIPIYGRANIERQLPLAATPKGEVWIVVGSLHSSWFSRSVGGVVEVQINKRDGRIVAISHGK